LYRPGSIGANHVTRRFPAAFTFVLGKRSGIPTVSARTSAGRDSAIVRNAGSPTPTRFGAFTIPISSGKPNPLGGSTEIAPSPASTNVHVPTACFTIVLLVPSTIENAPTAATDWRP
jgi:hypothetical protein